MKGSYFNVRGTVDFSQEQVFTYEKLRKKSIALFKLYGYSQLILPYLEQKSLFIKSVGRDTDIVQSQMMQIEGKDIVLRPEATAQIVRHYLQNRLDRKNSFYKFFYIGPMFRGERPQKGRLRQFNHIGAEVVGSDSFYLDAELIKMSVEIIDSIGINQKNLQVNSLGCKKDKHKLAAYIKSNLLKEKKKLCANCQIRIEKNPLRVVDCKKDSCRKIILSLQLDKNHLCPCCRVHFDSLLNALDSLKLDYIHNPYLVRGLDYYTNTVFEVISDRLGSQDALGAGGRYNNLFNQLGGIDVPAVGFALGVERIMLALGDLCVPKRNFLVFIARAQELEEQAFALLDVLRSNNLASLCDFRNKSLKAQLRYAQKIGAGFSVILGEDELNSNQVILRDMRNSIQEKVKLDDLVSKIKKKVGNYDEDAYLRAAD